MGSGTGEIQFSRSEKDVEQLGQEEIGDKHEDRGHDNGVSRGLPDSIGAASGPETIVATDDGDPEGKEHRFSDTAEDIVESDGCQDIDEVENCSDLELEYGDQQASEDSDGVSEDRQ